MPRTLPCTSAALTVAALMTLSALGGCHSASSRVDANGPVYPQSLADQRDPGARPDPLTGRAPHILDIQVQREGTSIRLTNTTARALGPGKLWINRWFARDLDGLDVAQSLTLPLDGFKDRYGESFRAGGFFATDKPDQISVVEYETDGSLYGLVSIGREQ